MGANAVLALSSGRRHAFADERKTRDKAMRNGVVI